MDKEKVAQLVREADQMLASAQQEMLRAAEDVITHVVCVNARQALTNYLTAFLLQNGVRHGEPANLAGLLDQCQMLDARFELVSLDNMDCRFTADPQDYCLSVDQVATCLRIAQLSSGIVNAAVPAY